MAETPTLAAHRLPQGGRGPLHVELADDRQPHADHPAGLPCHSAAVGLPPPGILGLSAGGHRSQTGSRQRVLPAAAHVAWRVGALRLGHRQRRPARTRRGEPRLVVELNRLARREVRGGVNGLPINRERRVTGLGRPRPADRRGGRNHVFPRNGAGCSQVSHQGAGYGRKRWRSSSLIAL